jgi:hypothetical protein
MSFLNPTKNCTSWLDFSNNLLCTPNRDCMQQLCSGEVGVSTKHLGVCKILVIHLIGLGFCTIRVPSLC